MEEKLSKGQQTRLKIVEKALELFGTNGFFQTSMQMIADECQLSQGAVMQHYPSKDKLLEAVRRHVTLSNHEFVDSKILITDSSIDALKKHLRYNFEWALKNRAANQIIILTYNSASFDDEYRKIATGAIKMGTDRIVKYLLAAEREKSISSKVPLDLLGEIIHEYIIGSMLRTTSSTSASKWTSSHEEKQNHFLNQILNIKN